ncbi:hypothetical protein [Polaribacter sp. IC073]|uniref:hypothetical protein n=1 Tax=Polaribacter sp. IC073 TaxID=2508540 RepID=UPI0011BEBC48|nr:hypothetical protein [Polaribacter sp. IC073]TXD45883.1 hypothetical protein ES045_15780 [Polaribacter sp. IC073]
MQPRTSIEANTRKQPTKEVDRFLILSVMSDKKGMTYKEIAKLLGWEGVKVMRRMSELVRDSKVEIKEVRACLVAGSKCSAYLKI